MGLNSRKKKQRYRWRSTQINENAGQNRERQEGEHNLRCRMPKDRLAVPRFADVPSAQGRWRWRRTVLEVSGVWVLGALELHDGIGGARETSRVGDGLRKPGGGTTGDDCAPSRSVRAPTRNHTRTSCLRTTELSSSFASDFLNRLNSRRRV